MRRPLVLSLLDNQVRWQIVRALAHSDRRVSELVHILGRPFNLVSYHLKRLKAHGLVTERRSSADSRAVYYSANLESLRAMLMASHEALHPALNPEAAAEPGRAHTGKRTRVLFLCTHNSARSQMAEAIMRHVGGERVEVFSAGTEPSRVHPLSLETLNALGVPAVGLRSKSSAEFAGQKFDYVITVCDRARESCPIFPGAPERIRWSFADPAAVESKAGQRHAFEQTAQQLKVRIQQLLAIMARAQDRAL